PLPVASTSPSSRRAPARPPRWTVPRSRVRTRPRPGSPWPASRWCRASGCPPIRRRSSPSPTAGRTPARSTPCAAVPRPPSSRRLPWPLPAGRARPALTAASRTCAPACWAPVPAAPTPTGPPCLSAPGTLSAGPTACSASPPLPPPGRRTLR
ncbi:hypothetical protein IWQ57_005092, partial [Coemansia nantahalensis]